MNKKLIVFSTLTTLLALPLVVLGQVPNQPGVINQPITTVVVNIFSAVINIIWVIAVAAVIIAFVIAGFKFLTAQGDPGEVAKARQAVIFGLVGALVIVLAWSVLAFVRNQFGV